MKSNNWIWKSVNYSLPDFDKPVLGITKPYNHMIPVIRVYEDGLWCWYQWSGLSGIYDLETYDDILEINIIKWCELPTNPPTGKE